MSEYLTVIASGNLEIIKSFCQDEDFSQDQDRILIFCQGLSFEAPEDRELVLKRLHHC